LGLLFIFDTAQTAYSISHANYILVAAPTKNERVDVSVIVAYIANIGGFFGTIIPTLLLVGESDKTLTVALFSGVLVLNAFLYWIAVRNIHDKAEMYKDDVHSSEGQLVQFVRESAKEAITSRSFIAFVIFQILGRGPIAFYFTPFLYMMDHVFKFSGGQATVIDVSSGLVMFVVVPFLGRWVKQVGLKRSIILSSFPAALGFLSLYFVQGFWGAMLGYWVVIVGSQVASLAIGPMLGAIIDEDEQNTDVRKAGLFTGLNALLTIPVSGIQAAIFTSLISYFGFVSGSADQNASALQGIRIGAGVIPFIFILLGILPMLFSPIDREKERQLSEFSEQRHRVDASDEIATAA
jgi:GPH family glycoside/pentoside/hexuronide:cation symporter